MTEAGNLSTGSAFGCSNTPGWVPYPNKIPRRHPTIDAVGRIDDPCARPAYNAPNYYPTPKFKPPREGYPDNICKIDNYEQEKNDAESGGATVNITVAPGTPHEICIRPQIYMQSDTVYANPPTVENCCADGRSLDTLKSEAAKILGPSHSHGHKNEKSPCNPTLREYPCRGVIRSPRPEFVRPSEESLCKPTHDDGSNGTVESLDSLNITGREFVEGMRTCDLYPIHPNLPKRFNNSEWFKGYGCERPTHPFYSTIAMDYGRFPPTAHTMTQSYFPRQCKFSDLLARAGMPRNRSLNLTGDKHIC